MEYLKYGDLSQYVKMGIQETEMKEIAKDVAQGLEVMHRYGFTHRDIKPQNILVVQKRPESPFWWVKISDFGLRPTAHQRFFNDEESDQTIEYSNTVDMWSFGCVLFNLASKGGVPFAGRELVRYCDRIIGFNPRNLLLNVQSNGQLLIESLLDPRPHSQPSANDVLQHRWLTTTKTGDCSVLSGQSPMMSSEQNIGQNFNSFLSSPLSKKSLTNGLTKSQPAATMADRTTQSPAGTIDIHNKATTHPIWSDATPSSSPIPSSMTRDKEATTKSGWITIPDVPALSPQSPFTTAIKYPERSETSTVTQKRSQSYKKADNRQSEAVILSSWREANKAKIAEHGASEPGLAAEQGDIEVLKILVKEGLDVREVCVGEYKHSLTSTAAYHGHLEVVEWLVERGASIDKKDTRGWRPLHWAARNGHLEVVKWLAEGGASIDEKAINGRRPLHLAAWNGHLEVVKLLAERGAQIHQELPRGWGLLHLAAENGHLEVVKLLAERSASIDEKSMNGLRPLHYAAGNGHLEVVKCLVERGENINSESHVWPTPQDMAESKEHHEVVKYLTEVGGVSRRQAELEREKRRKEQSKKAVPKWYKLYKPRFAHFGRSME